MKHTFLLLPAAVLMLPAMLPALAHAETISGRVLAPDGKPVVATVFYESSPGWMAEKPLVQSAPDGSFALEITPRKPSAAGPIAGEPKIKPESRGAVAAWAPGLSMGMALLRANAGAEGNVVRLSPLRKIEGVLRDDKGAPVAGAKVAVGFIFHLFGSGREFEHIFFRLPSAQAPFLSARTDKAGRWEIAGVPSVGGVSVQLDDEDFVPAAAQFDADGEPGGPNRRGLVARRAGSISGRVLDEKGQPAADVPVRAVAALGQQEAWNSEARSAQDGTFRIQRLVPGAYSLLVGSAGFPGDGAAKDSRAAYAAAAIQDVRVQAGEASSNHRLQLVAAAKVRGRVLDRATGQPLADAAVGAFGAGAPREMGPQVLARTDASGRYELALVPGANALYAFEEDRWGRNKPPEVKATPTSLAAGENKTRSLWVDRRFADLQGQVVLEDGTPARDVEITLWNSGGTGQSLRSDQAGRYSLRRLQLGAQRLDPRAEWSIVSPQKLSLPVPEGKPVRIVVRRNQMAKVSGRVIDGAGQPVAGAKLHFEMPAKKDGGDIRYILRGTSDQAGQYTLGELKMPEALGVELRSADLKGYKKRAGGGVPAGAKADQKADQPALQLEDIVLERLGRELRGTVTLGGRPVANALVRASGDDFENIASTDATGRFALGGQPEGALQVLVGQGRAFGRAGVANGEAKIDLQPGAAAPARDVARAAQVFREMAPIANASAIDSAARAIAPFDPAVAVELLLTRPAPAKAEAKAAEDKAITPEAARLRVIGFLTSKSTDAALSWAQDEMTGIAGPAEFVQAASEVGLLLSARQPEAARDLFEAASARLAQVPADKSLLARARLAALATRLKLPQAPELVSGVLESAGRDAGKLAELVAPLSTGSAALAAQVLEALPEKRERNISSYRSAIREVARYDAPGALPLLEAMRALVDAIPELPNQNGQYRGRDSWEFEWAFAAKDLMRALDRTQFETAANIARRVKLWHRPSALALAAEFGSPAQRLAMVSEALEGEQRGDWMKNVTLSRLGALAAPLDEKLAGDFFAQAATSLQAQRRESGESSASDWGFYAAFWNPAQARLALEADWQRSLERARERALKPDPQEDKHRFASYSQSSIAMAMSAVDADRALEMARELSDQPINALNPSIRGRALAFIGKVLLEEPAQRRLMVIASESGYDS